MRIEEYTVTGYRAESLSEGDCIYDIETTGHYWRTSALTAVSFAVPGASGEAVIRRAVSEKEADEYDLLVLAVRTLDKARRIITYNGTSGSLPRESIPRPLSRVPPAWPDLRLSVHEAAGSRGKDRSGPLRMLRRGTHAADPASFGSLRLL